MKVKHFIYASACLMGLAACNNEEIALNDNVMFDGKGELVELQDGFVLSMSKAALEETRALDADGKFQWMPSNPGLSEVVEKIGLCWTGVNNQNPTAAPLAATGNMVYTNYEFSHAGWLYTGENTPKYDNCAPFGLVNGEYNKASGLTTAATPSGSTYVASTGGKTLDLGKGIFNTKNGAIYSGEYIVYYPYSDEFFDSPIVASAPKLFEIDHTAANIYETFAKNSFNVGYVSNFVGGQESDNFATNMLSSATYIAFHNTGASAVNLKQVVLLAAGANDAFVTKQELSAQAIKNANNVPANIGTGLYLGAAKATSKTIVANYKTTLTVPASTTSANYKGTVVLPVLPTTISDLKILLVDQDNKTALIDCGSVEFKSLAKGDYSLAKNIDLKNITFKNEYIATDWSSLSSIIASVNGLAANVEATVKTIGDIELQGGYVQLTTHRNTRFYGDKLIVPADCSLDLGYAVTVENDIDLLHQGCCGTWPASLLLYDATLKGTINNYGVIQLGFGGVADRMTSTLDGATLNNLKGQETIKGEDVAYEGIIRVLQKMTLSLKGDAAINNEGIMSTEGTGITANDGTITIEQGSTATIANSGLIENGGNINASNGLSNSTTTAVFVDKVGSQLAGFGLDNTIGGQYICEVNDQVRYNTAIESAIRPTTLVRFVAGGNYKIAAGDVNNSKGNMVDFEVKTTGAVTFVNNVEDDEDNELVSTVKNVYLTQSSAVRFNKLFEVEEKLNTTATDFIVNKNLIVDSEFNVSGATQISKNVNVNALNSTCAMNVANATITFCNFGKSYFQTIANNGNVDILVASGVQGVAHELWTKSYTTGNTGIWVNNSRPLQY